MKETIKILLTLIFINFFLLGCIDKNDISNGASIEGECSLSTNYIPIYDPVALSAIDSDAPTIILLHGKSGSPDYIRNLALDFQNDGYNVVMPYMPWSGIQWNGTFCDSIAYLNRLILGEKIKTSGKVILAGHSLGATVALAYTAMSNTVKTDILNILAPGHFIHQSSVLASAHAVSITLAKEMVENNQSDPEYFQTYNNGINTEIYTTPEIYLSFHDVDEFPNIESTTPLIRIPLLWLAAIDDDLTSLAVTFGIIDLIPASENNKYDGTIAGDHFTFLIYVSDEFKNWYNDWYNGL